jgi:tetratricopeptide (TPR) repeat protein
MLSSTSHDLPRHRELAHKACLEAGVFPVGMEQLPARDETGVAVSLEMVDQADIYIGIYAFRYGWVPDGRDVSITEIEFDRAVSRKAEGKLREILIFTAHEEHPVTKRDVEADKVAQEKLDKFKARSAAGRVRKEFKSAEDLHRLVYQALSEFKSRQQRAAAAGTDDRPARTSIPNNLPRLQSFFGRKAELAKIREAIDPDNRTSWGTLIDGRGGMGKTSLAVRAAYDCPPEQFQRIVFVSVKDRELDDDGVRELGIFVLPGLLAMLNELARELGHEEVTKAPEDQRILLLLEALRGERALLILDNLESLPKPDRNKLLNFVERLPQGCKAILTSRESFGNVEDGFKLEQLGQEAALAIIADIAKRSKQLAKASEAERIALYEQTNGNPLLLRWVAGQVGRGSRRTLADALEFLRSCPPDNNPLEFVFGDMADEFTDDETKVLCALSHFNLPARVEHLTPVAECDEETAETALDILANRSLVVPNTEETAFTLVPMVADFLRRWKPEVIGETGDWLEKSAYALVVENGYKNFDNFPVLDAAWPTLAAALPRFLAGPNAQLQTVCTALHKFLEFTGRWDEWLALSRDAEVRAVAANDFPGAGWQAIFAGWVHYLRRQSADILACADRAEAHWREAQAGVRTRAIAIRLRGEGHLLAGSYPAAIAAYREAVELWRGLRGESDDVAIGLNTLAGAELLSGNLDDAERDYREALRIARAIDDREGIAIYIGNLADIALNRKDWSGAEALAFEALPLADKVGRKDIIASNCYRLAKALVQQGRNPEAVPHARRAVEIFTALRSPQLETARLILAECES